MSEPLLYQMPHAKLLSGCVEERMNRFVLKVTLRDRGESVLCYLANPGRLWELIYPGAEVLVAPAFGKLSYGALAAVSEGMIVPLHTHKINDLASALVSKHKIPGHERAAPVRREISVGDSRFDILLEEQGKKVFTEVKCCTLFCGRGAYFPDAPSERAVRHVRHLAELGRQGEAAMVLFIVNSGKAEWFLPDWHTDPDFARAMAESRQNVEFVAATVQWTASLGVEEHVSRIPIPWKTLQAQNCGHGFVLTFLKCGEGFFCFCEESADTVKTCARWARKKRNPKTPGEKMRAEGSLICTVPIRTPDPIGDALMADLHDRLKWDFVRQDGCFQARIDGDPRRSQAFVDLLMSYRFRRLDPLCAAELGLPSAD